MSVDPPTPAELERLQRVAAVGRYTPYTALEQSALQTLALCDWVREVERNVFVMTDSGRRFVKENPHDNER